ncbi:MAG: ATP-binding domain-containing protein [bacterium]|nr:ATP-binding domain-containing protein [bacterium]
MARMIPDIPKNYDPKSHEGFMFEELDELPEEYYVFHSFSIVTVKSDTLLESETDFVIFHPKKGIICLEAKAGQADYAEGCWRYGNGDKMHNGGPYYQANSSKWKLLDYMRRCGLAYEMEHCKLLHAVWFPDVPAEKLKKINLPAEAELQITLTADDFGSIREAVDRIFALEVPGGIVTSLSKTNINNILYKVLAPAFQLISLKEAATERTKRVFKRMLNEQVALLNYLEEQKSAIINGLAGTGKTVMAVSKAMRHAARNEKVLFLCYNSFLNEHLRKAYPSYFISYYTIDGFACKVCDTQTPDYKLLRERLEDMFYNDSFEYQHVIIDEGQDFGKAELEEEGVIDLLKANVLDNDSHPGSFYLFYDKNQLVQAQKVPAFIQEADCKLTLYRNCRNTESIASTSLKLLGFGKTPLLINDAVKGDRTEIGFCTGAEATVELLNSAIAKYKEARCQNIAILTCKTEQSSILADYCKDSSYKGGIKFTTCRKFKGLEADAVIVIDVDKETFADPQGELLMYVGASRAKFSLCCLINMSEDDCYQVLQQRNEKLPEEARENLDIKRIRDVFKYFANYFNADVFCRAAAKKL